MTLEATVLVEFKLRNVCTQDDLDSCDPPYNTLDGMVRWLIKEEGLFGICEDEFVVRKVTPFVHNEETSA